MDQINILVVDDQISSLLAIEDILQDIDARVVKASSAKEALMIMLKKGIDCVLLDVSMPEMDGIHHNHQATLWWFRSVPCCEMLAVSVETRRVSEAV